MFVASIDLSKLEYRSPTSNKNGGKVVHVSTQQGSLEWKDRLRFQMSEDQNTNRQTAIWGLSTPLQQNQDTSRRTLEVSIESPCLLKFLQDLDEQNMRVAQEKSEEWFKKSLSSEQIRNMYVTLVKPPSKEGSKHSVRVKVKCTDSYPTNIFAAKASDTNVFSYNKASHDELTKNVKCMIMCETVGLWFMSRQFGMSLTATDIVVWPNKRTTGIEAFTLSNNVKMVDDGHISVEEDF